MAKQSDKQATQRKNERRHQREKLPTFIKKGVIYAKKTRCHLVIQLIPELDNSVTKPIRYYTKAPKLIKQLLQARQDRLTIVDDLEHTFSQAICEKETFNTIFPEMSDIKGQMIIDCTGSLVKNVGDANSTSDGSVNTNTEQQQQQQQKSKPQQMRIDERRQSSDDKQIPKSKHSKRNTTSRVGTAVSGSNTDSDSADEEDEDEDEDF